MPILALTLTLSLIAQPAFAYIGPGAGLTIIGSVLAVFGAIILLMVGFVWYPIKRLLQRSKKYDSEGSDEQIE